jgi:hypothetical protein
MAEWPIPKCKIVVTWYREDVKVKEVEYVGFDLKRLTRIVSRNLDVALGAFTVFLQNK